MVGIGSTNRLISEALAGSELAWKHLLGQLWDGVERRVRASRRMGQLRGSDDDRREVASRVFARLRRNELRALRTFPSWAERNRDKTFDDWLTIIATPRFLPMQSPIRRDFAWSRARWTRILSGSASIRISARSSA